MENSKFASLPSDKLLPSASSNDVPLPVSLPTGTPVRPTTSMLPPKSLLPSGILPISKPSAVSPKIASQSPSCGLPLPSCEETLEPRQEGETAHQGEEPSDDAEETEGHTNEDSYNEMVPMMQSQLLTNPAFHVVMMADFYDGYTLRQQFEFFRQTVTCIPMFFTKQGITMIRGNGTNTLVTSTEIRERDLLEYQVDENYMNYKDQGAHVINVNLVEFHGHIKSVSKKESVRIFQYAEYPGVIMCQFYGGSKNSDGYVTVKTEPFTNHQYDIRDTTDKDPPNVKVPLAAFCSACTNVSRAKHPNSYIKCYPKGAHIVSGNETGSSTRNAQWGDCSGLPVTKSRLAVRGQTPIVYTTKIPLSVIKSLTRMANFNASGTIQIFCNGDGLVRLVTPLGCFGTTKTYLIEPEVQ